MSKPRVYILANPNKDNASDTLADLREWISGRADLVGAELTHDYTAIARARPDRIIVLGGDGTMLGVARALGPHQVPMIGVNLGKLGYLAEFSVEELKETFDQVVTNEALICQRMMLEVLLDEPQAALLALNDCVIHAGPPFRVIELDVQVDGEHLTTISGDGLIVATPGGSTAHNMSAGGPILQPGIRAFVLTPLSPHSLTHRPLVVEYDASIYVSVSQANPGTVVSIDGQLTTPVQAGAGLTIKRSPIEFPLIRNPKNNCFHTLVTKLQWGRLPTQS